LPKRLASRGIVPRFLALFWRFLTFSLGELADFRCSSAIYSGKRTLFAEIRTILAAKRTLFVAKRTLF
jgi:hypothetical protein